MLNFILWDFDPKLFSLGSLEPRWYGVMFALAFICGQYILLQVYKREGLSSKLLDKFAIYAVVGTVVGARLGHVFFYEPQDFLADPISILYVWKGGLASHGATIGLMVACYLYYRNNKNEVPSYIWVLDKLAIVVALAGFFIRTGNFFNSEIVGKATNASHGVVFQRNAVNQFNGSFYDPENNESLLNGSVEISSNGSPDTLINGQYFVPMEVKIPFKSGVKETEIQGRLDGVLVNYQNIPLDNQYVITHANSTYEIVLDGNRYVATLHAYGLPRHPTQLYEALTSLLLFGILFLLYQKKGSVEGLYVGLFFVWTFSLRFAHELLKENQVAAEDDMALNLGQKLSIPFILIGIYLLFKVLTKKDKNEA